MARIYAALIRKGIKTLEDVPARLRDAVAALISWWNNNSFTSAAIQADAEYARLKQKSE